MQSAPLLFLVEILERETGACDVLGNQRLTNLQYAWNYIRFPDRKIQAPQQAITFGPNTSENNLGETPVAHRKQVARTALA